MIDIAVIIVGINSREYVRGCLESLAQCEWHGYTHRVVYVDNGSSDGSVEMVRALFAGVAVIANPVNVGFCAACNQGVREVDSRYVYLLNNDTVVFPDSIWPLARFLEHEKSAAAAGNRLLNADQSDQWSARRFPTWVNAIFGRKTLLGRLFPGLPAVHDYLYKDELQRGNPFPVDWIPGSCTLVRRSVYLEAGGLPEDMHYWSDALFCARIQKRGYRIYVVPAAKLVHYEGKGTGGKTSRIRRWLITDFHRGAYRFYCEHFELGRYSPVRWIARAGLQGRAWFLIALDAFSQANGRTAKREAAS